MCVMSMVMDHYWDKWRRPEPFDQGLLPPVPQITPAEIDEFRKLLDRARKYDQKHRQPDCETEDKKRKLLDLARELGVEEQIKKVLESANP